MLQTVSKTFFQVLAGSQSLKNLASRYGMRARGGFARRFIAGETVEAAVDAARQIQANGLGVTLDYLGERVASIAEADAATRAYIGILGQIAAAGVERNISLKLTQLGLTIDRATCVDNLRRILDAAAARECFVRVDMESSPFTAVTLDVFETMWQQGYRNAGVVLQSYLPRSEADAARMNALGARVRLVKGAYNEPRDAAYQSKADVDAAFVRIMKTPSRRTIRRCSTPRAPSRRIARLIRRHTNSRCCTVSAATCRARSNATDSGSASTFHSVVNGSPTSCVVWGNAPRISVS